MGKVYASIVCAGVDVHYKTSTVSFLDSSAKAVRHETLDHRDREHLRKRLRQWPKGLMVVMEGSFGWGWLSDEMAAAGLDVHISNCYKVAGWREARGQTKTNVKDADLEAALSLERTRWWEVWRAPREVRDRREVMRHRQDLVETQTTIKNRIHSVFHRHGLYHEFSDLFGAAGRRYLERLSKEGDADLPEEARHVLESQWSMLGHVREELARTVGHLRRTLERTPEVGWVDSIPGFGVVLSEVVVSEIGRIERFRSERKLASYSVLAPRTHDTGEARPGRAPLGRHVGKRGNRTLQWAFIEAAHGAVRHGGRLRAMYDRATDGGKRDCNRGYMKVARELVRLVYAVLKQRRNYSVTRPEPGRGPAAGEGSGTKDLVRERAGSTAL